VAGSDRPWGRAAWSLWVVGVVLVWWGFSMGFTRHGVTHLTRYTNWEAVGRVAIGCVLVVAALVVATVIAPRLSVAGRRLWMIVMGVTVFFGSGVPAVTVFPVDAVCGRTSFYDDIDCRLFWGFVLLLAAVGVSVVLLVAFSVWSRSRQASDHRHHLDA